MPRFIPVPSSQGLDTPRKSEQLNIKVIPLTFVSQYFLAMVLVVLEART
jgi:hypothetical protein